MARASPGIAHAEGLDEVSAARFAQLALDCVHKEYPNKIAHFMTVAARSARRRGCMRIHR
ncbi:MAG: hypothetical protein ACREXP_31475 [Steroidobacteraceae bacterium]